MWKKFPWLQAESEEGADLGGAPDVPSTESAEASTDAEVNWSEFDEGDDETLEGDSLVVADSPPSVQPPAEAQAPAEQPVAQAPEVPQTPPTPTVAPSEPPVDPAAQAEAYKTWRAERLTELESQYALDEASAVTLQTDPEKVLPALAAKVHMEVMESAMRAMQHMLPTVLGRLQQGSELNTRAKNLFTTTNPDLADPQYEGAILQLGQVYRSMNKTAPPEEAARAIGGLVRAAYGLVGPGSAPAAGSPASPAPVTQSGFVPARGSGGAARPAPSTNPYSAMAEEMLMSDDM